MKGQPAMAISMSGLQDGPGFVPMTLSSASRSALTSRSSSLAPPAPRHVPQRAQRGRAAEASCPTPLAALCGGAAAGAAGRRRRRARAAPVATAQPKVVESAVIFEDLFSKSNRAAKLLSDLPNALPMSALSSYTAVPLLSAVAAWVCPRHTRLAQLLAGALGCLLGTLVGAFLKQAKKDAAKCALTRLLSMHLDQEMPMEDLQELVRQQRKRFGVPVEEQISETWENTSLQRVYEELLMSFLDNPEHNSDELALLVRLKEVLQLDGIVAGNAHRHCAQLLVAKGYGGLEGDEMKLATDKLLFLSERIFASEVPEEAGRYEMGRLCAVLQLSKKEAVQRVREVSIELFGEDKTSGLDQDDASSSKFFRVRQELSDRLRVMYNTACKASRNNAQAALASMDEMVEFAKSSEPVLSQLLQDPAEAAFVEGMEPTLTLTADPLPGRRLYGLFFERAMQGSAPSAVKPEEFGRLLELSDDDMERARVDLCQPKLKELYESCIQKAESTKKPLAELKPEVSDQMAKFQLPYTAVEDTALEVYKSFVEKVGGQVLKTAEKEQLDKIREFLELEKDSVRRMHLKAFASVYEFSVREALGRSQLITAEAQEALVQLGDRLGLEEEDTKKIFYGVIEENIKEMMIPVRDAWEEATYTKEALLQLNKERGKDLGDDPTADGTGAELGIKDSPPLEGVRGFKLMEELSKVADFYTRNKVLKEDAPEPIDDDDEAWAEAYPVQVGKWIEDKNKEEMFGIFAWNAITCQDTTSRERWTNAKPTVGGILGLSPKVQKKVVVRMVSRWCNMFIKSKVQEQGELKKDDVQMLTEWAPMFFGIDKEVLQDLVKVANKSLLQNKVLKLLNKPSVSPEDLNTLRAEVSEWDLEVATDLELSRPQLRSLFKVEISAVLEDDDLSDEQKVDGIDASREAFGLAEKEAKDEMHDLIRSRCRASLVNASGDLLQENPGAAVDQMRRLETLAAFGLSAGVEFQDDWEVAPAMRRKLLQTYLSGCKGKAPDMTMLERVLKL